MKNINKILLFLILSVFSLVEIANSKVTVTKINDNLRKWTITENNQTTERYFIRFVVPNSAPRKVLWVNAVKKNSPDAATAGITIEATGKTISVPTSGDYVVSAAGMKELESAANSSSGSDGGGGGGC